jgi:hypothetical protein
MSHPLRKFGQTLLKKEVGATEAVSYLCAELGKHVPEVGLELHCRPCKQLGSRGNMRNPRRIGPSTNRSEAQNVHNVHTPKFAFLRT